MFRSSRSNMLSDMKSPREMSEAFTAAFNAHDLKKAAELYRPDVVFTSPDAGELKGREQVLEYFRIFLQAFPDTRIEVLAKHEAGETIIDEWIYRGTHTGPLVLPSGETIPATGKR